MDNKALSELHDAKLVGIAYESDRSILIHFITDASEKKTLTLRRVVNFFCTGMLEGNIIQSVDVIAESEISAEDLKYFVNREGRGQSVEQLARAIKSQALSMILLSPSYGAELGCVCADIAYA